MIHLQYLVVFVAVVGQVLMTPLTTEKEDVEKRDSGHCTVNGRVYRHGEVFTIGNSRCIKYRCIFGGYDFYEEGCDQWNQCWTVNREFQYQCRRYVCSATTIGNYKRYEVIPVGLQMCQDYAGRCRKPGDHFPYFMKGQLKRDCTCQPSGSYTSYYCYN